jgi:hypothetical protein
MVGIKRVGDAFAWIEQEGSIYLKSVSREGDPLELSAGEARQLAEVLNSLAAELDRLEPTES